MVYPVGSSISEGYPGFTQYRFYGGKHRFGFSSPCLRLPPYGVIVCGMVGLSVAQSRILKSSTSRRPFCLARLIMLRHSDRVEILQEIR
jgi:hypothetical protein